MIEWILILGASIDRPDRSPVAEESETNLDVDMCPNPDENKGPKLKKMLSLESGKEGIKQMKKVLTTYLKGHNLVSYFILVKSSENILFFHLHFT